MRYKSPGNVVSVANVSRSLYRQFPLPAATDAARDEALIQAHLRENPMD